jgi:hypothetical protein
MRTRAVLAGAVLTLVVLVGCGGGAVGVSASPAESQADPSATSTPAPDPTSPPPRDALAACEAFIGDAGEASLMQRVPDALTSIGPTLDTYTAQVMAGIGRQIDEAIAVAPADIAAHLRSVQIPFQQAADALAAGGGGGPITLNTGAARDAIPPLLAACADAGYKSPERDVR